MAPTRYPFTTAFDLPVVGLVGHLIDGIVRLRTGPDEVASAIATMVADMFDGFNYLFFDFTRGDYFKEMREHPELYLYERPLVKRWLQWRKASGQILVLATNSRLDCTGGGSRLCRSGGFLFFLFFLT